MIRLLMIVFAVLFLTVSCVNENEEDLYGNKNENLCDTANVTYSGNISEIMDNNCISCHNNSMPLGGVNLEGYQNVLSVANSGTLVGSIKYSTGYSPMPPDSNKLDDCTILKVETWVNKGALNN